MTRLLALFQNIKKDFFFNWGFSGKGRVSEKWGLLRKSEESEKRTFFEIRNTISEMRNAKQEK